MERERESLRERKSKEHKALYLELYCPSRSSIGNECSFDDRQGFEVSRWKLFCDPERNFRSSTVRPRWIRLGQSAWSSLLDISPKPLRRGNCSDCVHSKPQCRMRSARIALVIHEITLRIYSRLSAVSHYLHRVTAICLLYLTCLISVLTDRSDI